MEGKNSGLIDQSTLFSIQGEDHHNDDGWKTVRYDRRRSRNLKSLRIQSEEGSSQDNNTNCYVDGAESEIKEPDQVDAPANVGETGGSMAVESGGGDVELEKNHKRTEITFADAAADINAANLVGFLVDISKAYDTMQDVQLMRFVDYFSNVFAEVSPSQFPWIKILNESSVSKMTDIPLGCIPEQVYKTSVDWLSRCAFDELGSYVLLSLDNIIGDNLELDRAVGVAEESKKVSTFVILAMILRCKPEVLISLWPILKDDEKFEERNNATLPLMMWAITQALQGDISVGLFMWVRYLLRTLEVDDESNSNLNLPSTHLILQVVERILSSPKARNILVNGAVRKGERLVPPSALELLMRLTFSSPSEEISKRFEGIYPTLKEVAIALPHGSKAMKQITRQIMQFAIKAVGEGVPDLSREACNLFIWCLTQNPNCFKIWDDIYLENVEGSAYVLEKLSEDHQWKTTFYINHPTHEPFKDTIKNFRMKNEKAMEAMESANSRQESLKVSERSCKKILRQVSHGRDRCTTTTFVIAAIGVGLGVAAATASTFFIRLNFRDYM